jgi:hypothetical protein
MVKSWSPKKPADIKLKWTWYFVREPTDKKESLSFDETLHYN